MMCDGCARDAIWLVFTDGSEYVGRVCNDHVSTMHGQRKTSIRRRLTL